MRRGALEISPGAGATLWTSPRGVSLGAHTPYHEPILKSFNPTSSDVGMLGASLVRSLEVTKSPRALPEVASGRSAVQGSMKSCTLPLKRSALAGAVPL